MSSPPPVHSCVFLRRSGAVRVPHAQKQALLSHWVFSPAARQRGLLYKLLGWKIPSPRFSHEAGRRPAGTLINLLSPGEKQASFIASPTQPMSAQYFSHSSGLLSIYLSILYYRYYFVLFILHDHAEVVCTHISIKSLSHLSHLLFSRYGFLQIGSELFFFFFDTEVTLTLKE